MTIALKTVNYLDKEKEFIPWRASLTELGYVDSMLERTALYGPFSVRNFRISGSFPFYITKYRIRGNYTGIFMLFAIRNFLNRQKWLTQSKQVTHFRKFCDKARIHDKSLFTLCVFSFILFFFFLNLIVFFFAWMLERKMKYAIQMNATR